MRRQPLQFFEFTRKGRLEVLRYIFLIVYMHARNSVLLSQMDYPNDREVLETVHCAEPVSFRYVCLPETSMLI